MSVTSTSNTSYYQGIHELESLMNYAQILQNQEAESKEYTYNDIIERINTAVINPLFKQLELNYALSMWLLICQNEEGSVPTPYTRRIAVKVAKSSNYLY